MEQWYLMIMMIVGSPLDPPLIQNIPVAKQDCLEAETRFRMAIFNGKRPYPYQALVYCYRETGPKDR